MLESWGLKMKCEKVLVTGGSGFIGSHLIPELVKLEYDVYSLERYVTGRYVLGGRRAVKTVFGDLDFEIEEIVDLKISKLRWIRLFFSII